ncbi:amidohydrolase [Hazenella coriacea]|uniref:Amidohydrolase 3 domain-containing protein n=1 Tax=Hazenella coriacea TaxID=1179467 RepID=A0A4R3L6Q0_9BACL|nr:amidohydrolase [Hazenella coriacea]TCS95102.1 hypothetical protein EDD58_103528 [Hazenella coriacea]
MSQTIFHHGHIVTLDPTCPQAEAVVVENGKIIAMGSNKEMENLFHQGHVQRVDLEGGYVYPGLVDSHMHLSGLGQKCQMLDFTHCRSKTDLLEKMKERASMINPGEWIIGVGWDENRMGGEVPSLAELDEAFPYHPVFLSRICYHAYLVNTCAYRKAGVTEDQSDPEDGSFGRDLSGKLNGWVYENASFIFNQAQPEPSYQDKKETMRIAMKKALACGLTAVHSDDLRYIASVEELIRICQELYEEGIFLRTHHLVYHPYLLEIDRLSPQERQGNEWFRLGACKIFADGAIGGRTALLSEPYADDPNNQGMAIHEQVELLHLTQQAAQRNMPIAVHAIGDEAVDRVIQAMKAYSIQGSGLRHRLIHAQVLRADLVRELEEMDDVAVDIQPRFVASDFPWVLERVGEKRSAFAYAWKTLHQAGIVCAGGSDAPIEPVNPLLGIHAAVTRRRLEDSVDHPGYLPEQKLAALEALMLFTKGSAYAEGEEHRRGTISVGKQADFSVFDRDLLTGDVDELLKAQTLQTIINGKIAFQK